jgi:hypothetical protein
MVPKTSQQQPLNILMGSGVTKRREGGGAGVIHDLGLLVLPPFRYYAARRWLSSRGWYRRFRVKAMPVPKITRAAGPEEFKA